MSKWLDLNNILDAATDSKLPNLDEHLGNLHQVIDSLAADLADHLGVKVKYPAAYERDAGGLCVAFGPATPGQECPEVIHEGDVSGDWE